MNIDYSVPKLKHLIEGKKILFITTKNIDYLRNTQEIRILKEIATDVDIMYSKKKNNLLRIIDVWNQIRKSHIKADVVFVGFEPQFILPFFGKKFTRSTVIVDFFISVYDTLVCDRKKIKDGLLLSKFCHWLDEKTIRLADLIISDTKAHKDYFVNEFGASPEKMEVLYLEADSSIYYPREQRKTEHLKDKYVVLYFGSILPLQGVDVVLDTIRALKDDSKVYFDIIGPIPSMYNKPIQENAEYHEWLSQEELAEHIANADLCLAGHFNQDIEKARRTIPGKAYIYEMMKKKIILGNNSANRELFDEDEYHFFVEMSNAPALVSTIKRIENGMF